MLIAVAPTTEAPAARVIIRLPEVMRRTGLSKSTIYARIKARTFPQPVRLGGDAGPGDWLEHEVEAWLALRVAARPASQPTPA